jgi:phosphoglycerate dehydrogenase-like enzyme
MRRVVFNMLDERPAWAPPSWVAARIRDALSDDFEFIEVTAPVSGRGDGGGVSEEALRAVRGAEVCFGLGLPRDLLAAALDAPRRLRWFHTGAAGVASLLHPELRDAGVTLTNSAGIHAPAIAETVIGMMLFFARGFDHAIAARQRGDWDPAPWERVDSGIRELDGATLGIVGYGGIGRAVAARGHALGMRVVASRRTPGPEDGVELLHGDDAVDSIFARSDFVVLTVPSTPQTRGLVGRAQLERMRPDAVLVNVARGDVVDEAALIDTLRAGRIRGAALDVFATEPLPPASPLWQLDTVLITPHVSATTPRYWEREAELMLDNLKRYRDGEPLRNVVDLTAGY